jgi:hypothetical protein
VALDDEIPSERLEEQREQRRGLSLERSKILRVPLCQASVVDA